MNNVQIIKEVQKAQSEMHFDNYDCDALELMQRLVRCRDCRWREKGGGL